jgi:hypothetical protein
VVSHQASWEAYPSAQISREGAVFCWPAKVRTLVAHEQSQPSQVVRVSGRTDRLSMPYN